MICHSSEIRMQKWFVTVQKVNAFACEKLSQMEEHYPIITRPADELWKEGMEKCSFAIQPVTGSMNMVRNRYNNIVNKGHQTVNNKEFLIDK